MDMLWNPANNVLSSTTKTSTEPTRMLHRFCQSGLISSRERRSTVCAREETTGGWYKILTTVTAFDNGTPALLLLVWGLIPVEWQGATYRYPIDIWIPHAYPRDAPIAYIKPTSDMAVRPGQHVSVEGRIYHPFLAQWPTQPDRSNITDFVFILRDIFSKEPPVRARQQHTPQLPQSPLSHETTLRGRGPPARPPKPADTTAANARGTPPPSSGPPLPPKPGQVVAYDDGSRYKSPMPSSTYGTPGPPPARVPQQTFHTSAQQQHYGSPSPVYASAHHSHPYQPPNVITSPSGQYASPQPDPHVHRYQGSRHPHPYQHNSAHQAQMATPAHFSQQQKGRHAVPDLMDSPLDVTLPSQNGSASSIPAPPIPPNPEKDAILQTLSATLRAQLEQTIGHNTAAVPALEAQHAALQQSHQNMQAELYHLEELEKLLASNEKILHESMQEADRVAESVSRREVPSVDEVLVAPTVVGEQLYQLVADERSISDAIFLLSRALDKGRIEADVFVKEVQVASAYSAYVRGRVTSRLHQLQTNDAIFSTSVLFRPKTGQTADGPMFTPEPLKRIGENDPSDPGSWERKASLWR
ncbi:hypothetical protein FH972_021849 [Carpinus fangiana]|uniref:UEV domain-containing protein n=1 Tax=Carpinus fangiana TaxID=176857 RepID=A0A5N6KQW5_9ROSI|nr:hypothetical protein FH972_021849 [Carpinus fangiana]